MAATGRCCSRPPCSMAATPAVSRRSCPATATPRSAMSGSVCDFAKARSGNSSAAGSACSRPVGIRLPFPEVGRFLVPITENLPHRRVLRVGADGLFLVFLGIAYAWQANRSPTSGPLNRGPITACWPFSRPRPASSCFLVSERYIFTDSPAARAPPLVAAPLLRLRLRTDLPHVTHCRHGTEKSSECWSCSS